MNAPFFRPGTRITHAALSRRSWGMALSGVPIISEKSAADSSRRSVTLGFSSAAIAAAHPTDSSKVKLIQRMSQSYTRQRAASSVKFGTGGALASLQLSRFDSVHRRRGHHPAEPHGFDGRGGHDHHRA